MEIFTNLTDSPDQLNQQNFSERMMNREYKKTSGFTPRDISLNTGPNHQSNAEQVRNNDIKLLLLKSSRSMLLF